MSSQPREFSLAYLTLLGTPPRQMIEIAGEAGYDYVSLRLAPVTEDEPQFPFLTDPGLVADVARALGETGVSLLDVELIRTDPGTSTKNFSRFIDVAAELGARHVITQIPEPDRGLAVERFQEVCELAGSHGMTVDLEFIPWSPTADLDDAAEIVAKVSQPNAAVLVDTLHFARSNSSVSKLSGLPAEMFNFVQLCDAQASKSGSHEELIRVARSDRRAPGQGIIDLVPIVEAMPRLPYALEVPNDTMRDELGALQYARHVLETTKQFFESADADTAAAAG